MRFAENLKTLMRASGDTQDTLASSLGLSRGAIGHYVNGRREPDASTLAKISDRYGINIDSLLRGDVTMLDNSDAVNLALKLNLSDNPFLSTDEAWTLLETRGIVNGRLFAGIAEQANAYPVASRSRQIPVLGDIQAGNPTEYLVDYEVGAGDDFITVEESAGFGENTFAFRIKGDSMLAQGQANSFSEGDIVIIDPSRPVRPGAFVIAKLDGSDEATFKQYRDRGTSKDGHAIFDLHPLNPAYSTIRVDEHNPGRIIGPLVEHRRRF